MLEESDDIRGITINSCFPPSEHPSTAFSDRDKQTPTPVDDSPRAGLPHTDSGIGEEGHVAGSLNGSELGLGLGLGLVGRETDRDRDRDIGGIMGGGVGGGGAGGTDLLCSLSDVRRSQESLLDSPQNPGSTPNSSQAPPSSITSISQTNKGINVKVGGVSVNRLQSAILLITHSDTEIVLFNFNPQLAPEADRGL